jgi:hypothetical protein
MSKGYLAVAMISELVVSAEAFCEIRKEICRGYTYLLTMTPSRIAVCGKPSASPSHYTTNHDWGSLFSIIPNRGIPNNKALRSPEAGKRRTEI